MYWFLSKFPFLSLCSKLRLPLLACLSNVGGSGLFCVLSSLMDPRSVITFQSVQVFICWGGVVTSKLLTWEFGNRHPSHSFLLMIALWIANEMWDRSCLKSYSPIKKKFQRKTLFLSFDVALYTLMPWTAVLWPWAEKPQDKSQLLRTAD